MAVTKVKRDGRTFYIAVVNYVDDDGKRRQLKRNARTRDEAKLREAELISKRAEGATPSRTSLSHFAELWLSRQKGLRESSLTKYRERLTHATKTLGDVRLSRLTPAMIDNLYDTLLDGRRSNRTVLEVHRVLRHALSDAVRWGVIDANPADRARPPKSAKYRHEVATLDDLRGVFAAADGTAIAALVRVAAWTGARLGELLALEWRNVDLQAGTFRIERSISATGTVTIPKTVSGIRRVSLSPATIDVLASVPRLGDLVFPFTHRQVATAWRALRKRTGLRLRFHDLRHAHATHMLRQGFPVAVVSARLGHANAAITLGIYTHALPDQDVDLAQAVDTHMR